MNVFAQFLRRLDGLFLVTTSACVLAPLASTACSDNSSDTGAGGAGGEANGGASGVGLGGASNATVGTFAVQLAGGVTTVQGKVYSGESAENLVWDEEAVVGDCRLLVPRIPFCETSCDSGSVCVEDEVCRAAPSSLDVGTVTVAGVANAEDVSPVTLRAILNNYQTPSDITWTYPGFATAAPITVSADGGALSAFELEALGVTPLDITSDAPHLDGATPIALEWAAESSSVATNVFVKLDISHHGGTRGVIECETKDDGALEIDGDLVKSLIDKGTAGFPSILVTRRSADSVQTEIGFVSLNVESIVQQEVTIEGLVSCNTDDDCTEGSCDTDRVCR